jgi:V/A-type H+-transporting ATPase subunit I
LRLQFVEFFGKFYTGGGREFSPFMAKREITELKGGDA